MILGLGNDLVDTRRLQAAWDRRGARFLQRLYTSDEQAFCLSRPNPVDALGRCYAAKEAAVKALGTGFTHGIGWRSVEVVRRQGQRSTLAFHGEALARLHHLTPVGMGVNWQLSISDEPPYASAVVVLFAVLDIQD